MTLQQESQIATERHADQIVACWCGRAARLQKASARHWRARCSKLGCWCGPCAAISSEQDEAATIAAAVAAWNHARG